VSCYRTTQCEHQIPGKANAVEFFIIPDLKQYVYLGVDFWQKFGLLDRITDDKGAVAELDVGREEIDGTIKNHVLSAAQQDRLLGPWSVAGNFLPSVLITSQKGIFFDSAMEVGSAIQRPPLGLRTGSGGAFMNN